MKFVLVTGGVISGIGKGIITSSTGLLLKLSGLNVTAIKIDPYLNIDAGTMSPLEHGEVFVLDDGGEVDLDLGTYERFLDVSLTRKHNITTGRIYQQVLAQERQGDFLGKTVQMVPHVTNSIIGWILRAAAIPVASGNCQPEVCMIELGGTVGDIESMIFLEALRQLRFRCGPDNWAHLHVSLVPIVGEAKSKPTQHGIKALLSAGFVPDLIMCRSEQPVSTTIKDKLSLFCMVPPEHIISVHNVSNTYYVPQLLLEQNVDKILQKKLGYLDTETLKSLGYLVPPGDPTPSFTQWKKLVVPPEFTRTVAVVGKYIQLTDAYLSISKALYHAGHAAGFTIRVIWVDSSKLDASNTRAMLEPAAGILVPGGFGERGTAGKLAAIRYARETATPFLGICLGMQLAIVEYARNVLGWRGANSTEFDETPDHPVVMYMPEISQTQMGGTMRLGMRKTLIAPGCLAEKLYGSTEINERHRHRYEINPEYLEALTGPGSKLVFSGCDETHQRMEIVELDEHPFFLGTQYHPEYLSRPLAPSPVFLGFVKALEYHF